MDAFISTQNICVIVSIRRCIKCLEGSLQAHSWRGACIPTAPGIRLACRHSWEKKKTTPHYICPDTSRSPKLHWIMRGYSVHFPGTRSRSYPLGLLHLTGQLGWTGIGARTIYSTSNSISLYLFQRETGMGIGMGSTMFLTFKSPTNTTRYLIGQFEFSGSMKCIRNY